MKTLRVAVHLARVEARRELTRARLAATGAATAVLAILGHQLDENALAFLPALVLPGTAWILWQAAGHAGQARARSTEHWLLHGAARPVVLAGAVLAGTVAPGALLVAAGLLGWAADGHPGEAHAALAWIVAATLGLAALGGWRHAEEPRAARAFQGRSLVLTLTLALAAGWWLADALDHPRAFGGGGVDWTWWGVPVGRTLVFALGGWGLGACALWGLARAHALHAERNARTASGALLAVAAWIWIWIAGFNDGPTPLLWPLAIVAGLVAVGRVRGPWGNGSIAQSAGAFALGAGLALIVAPDPQHAALRAIAATLGLGVLVFALPLVQPRTRPAPRHDPVLAGTAAFAAAGAMAAAFTYRIGASAQWGGPVTSPHLLGPFSPGMEPVPAWQVASWVLAGVLYGVRDLAAFAVLRRYLGERPGWIWVTAVLVCDVGIVVATAQADLAWWTGALAGLPLGHAVSQDLPTHAGLWCSGIAGVQAAVLAWWGWGRPERTGARAREPWQRPA